MHGDTDCVFTRMNYIMKDETCFRFICTQVMVQCLGTRVAYMNVGMYLTRLSFKLYAMARPEPRYK